MVREGVPQSGSGRGEGPVAHAVELGSGHVEVVCVGWGVRSS